MYYKEEFIHNLLSGIPITSYISRYVKLVQHGSRFWGVCPFHQEKFPSFMVDPSNSSFTCFGCGRTGNVITFAMGIHNISFMEAVTMLSKEYGLEIKRHPRNTHNAACYNYYKERNELYKINQAAAQYFHSNLLCGQNPAIHYYTCDRKLSLHTIESFCLGYMNNNADALYTHFIKSGFSEETIIKSKLMGRTEEGKWYSFFRNRAMIPIFDINKRVIGFGGRVLNDTDVPKYLNSPETLIFNKRCSLFGLDKALKCSLDNVILCEGYMDVITLNQAGFGHSVASLGTSFTPEQACILKHKVHNIYLSYDSDAAGCAATQKVISVCRKAGLKVKIINMDPYKDPDEFIMKLGADVYKERMNKAVSDRIFTLRYYERIFEQACQDMNYTNISRKLAEYASECNQSTGAVRASDKYTEFMRSYHNIVQHYYEQIMRGCS